MRMEGRGCGCWELTGLGPDPDLVGEPAVAAVGVAVARAGEGLRRK